MATNTIFISHIHYLALYHLCCTSYCCDSLQEFPKGVIITQAKISLKSMERTTIENMKT